MRRATLFLRLLTGFILSLLPLAGTSLAAWPSLPHALPDGSATLYHEVQRGGYVYRPAPAYRPPPVYRPAPRATPRPSPNITRPAPRPNAVQPRPSTRQALPNQQRTPGTTVRPGTGSGRVLGAPIQRPRVFSLPRQQAQGGKPAPNVRKALPQTQKQTIRAKLERMRMALRTKLERLRKGGGQGGKSGSGGGGSSGAAGKPPATNGAGPPNRPRLTQIFNATANGRLTKENITIAKNLTRSFDLARHRDIKGYDGGGWPKNGGFLVPPKQKLLSVGTKIDRYGEAGGTYASPFGIPYERRSLPRGSDKLPYQGYIVQKPLPVMAGKVAPAFGQKGMGTQYKMEKSIAELIREEYISPF